MGIIGAGMSGLGMAAMLRRRGYEHFVVYEKANEVGGTWRDNTYPGLSCDVPSRFYSYSFAPNPEWSKNFASGEEIENYFKWFAAEYDLHCHIRFDTEVSKAEWDGSRYLIETTGGDTDVVDVLVSATGVLRVPNMPDIAGLDTFKGASFHSARWDHSVPLRGKRVGVIGTGATGAQIVSALGGVAEPLYVFQRTPQWILPLPQLPYSPISRAVLRRVPGLNRLSYRAYQKIMETLIGRAAVEPGWQRTLVSGLARANLRYLVRDDKLREQLTPPDQPMCKRLIMSAEFYPAVQRDDVEVVTDPITRVEPDGVRTKDGALRELDVLVLATGFDSHAYLRPMRLIGENGRTLDEAWADGPKAYRTVAVPGFPNFFTLIGPHSPIGNHSLIAIAEAQADYILRWLDDISAGRAHHVVPRADATERFNRRMREAMPNTVWTTGCQSWYLGPDGQPELWPWTPAEHRQMLGEPVREDFEVRTQPQTTGVTA